MEYSTRNPHSNALGEYLYRMVHALNLKDGYIKVMGKGAKERVVPIGKYTQMTLWSYIDKVRPESAIPNISNLFLSSNGKPITINTIRLMMKVFASPVRLPIKDQSILRPVALNMISSTSISNGIDDEKAATMNSSGLSAENQVSLAAIKPNIAPVPP